MADKKPIPGAEPDVDTEISDPEIDNSEDDEIEDVETDNEEDTEADGEASPVVYTQEQVESAVKARVNTMNRKVEKLKPFETAVKRISEITGLTPDALIERLQGLSDVEQAKILGMTPQQLAQKRRIDQATKASLDTTGKLQRQLDEQTLLADPKYKDYPLYKEEVMDLLDDNPKLTLKQAYILAKGELGTKAAVRDAEQRAVAKMTKSSNQRVIPQGSSGGAGNAKLSPSIVSAAKRVGMDPAEYAAYSNMSSLDDYEKFKSKKK